MRREIGHLAPSTSIAAKSLLVSRRTMAGEERGEKGWGTFVPVFVKIAIE
jgi:hypothetical protein